MRREININYECLSRFLNLVVLLPQESGLFRVSAAAAEVPCDALQRHRGSKKVLQGMIPITSQVPVLYLHTHTRSPKGKKSWVTCFTPAVTHISILSMGLLPLPWGPAWSLQLLLPALAVGVGSVRAKGSRPSRSGACGVRRCPVELIAVTY